MKVAINGFGRIGRNFFRAVKASGADIDFVAANDLGSVDTMAHLLANDTVGGRYPGTVKVVDDGIDVDGDTVKILAERDPVAFWQTVAALLGLAVIGLLGVVALA